MVAAISKEIDEEPDSAVEEDRVKIKDKGTKVQIPEF